MGIIKASMISLFVLVAPVMCAFGVWFILDPVTFWQRIVALIVSSIVFVAVVFFDYELVSDRM